MYLDVRVLRKSRFTVQNILELLVLPGEMLLLKTVLFMVGRTSLHHRSEMKGLRKRRPVGWK